MTSEQFLTWLHSPGPRRPLVMGILNVTPDSFSDGNRHASVDAAIAHADGMIAAGADLIDAGGESTRPGAARTPPEEQMRRLLPVLREFHHRSSLAISVDTTRATVAEAALDAGVTFVNDISGGMDDPAMLPMVARRRVPIVLMHMQGQPATMQLAPQYVDVVKEIAEHLRGRLAAAIAAGVSEENVMLDPGIGFGKTIAHDLELLRRVDELAQLGRPLLLGTSRKKFIGRITGETDPAQRVIGTAAAVAWCVSHGAEIVRVHDVEPAVKVVRMIRAIQLGWEEPA